MAKLPRITQKIFAQNSGTNDVTVFGTAKNGNDAVFTKDINQIMNSDAFSQGWGSATLTDDAPFQEDMNGVQLASSQQLAYLFENGMPEWDENTTYYANTSFCQVNGVWYQSLTDNNIGNNPVSDNNSNWQELNLQFNSNRIVDLIYPVGSIYMSVNTTSPSVLFGGVWEQIQGRFLLASDTNNPVGTTGGEATHTLTTAEMPSHTHSGSSVSAGAHTHSKGTQNITGSFNMGQPNGTGNYLGFRSYSGAYYNNGESNGAGASGGTWGCTTLGFSATNSWSGATSSNGAHTHTINVGSTGSGSAHNNMPPYLAVNIWKRTA